MMTLLSNDTQPRPSPTRLPKQHKAMEEEEEEEGEEEE
jgi:hypothetical protein